MNETRWPSTWPWYIGTVAVFALAIFAVLYAPFWILDLWRARARRLAALQSMLGAEAVLRRDWDSPDEDQAWSDL